MRFSVIFLSFMLISSFSHAVIVSMDLATGTYFVDSSGSIGK